MKKNIVFVMISMCLSACYANKNANVSVTDSASKQMQEVTTVHNLVREKSNPLLVRLFRISDMTILNEEKDYQIPIRYYRFGNTTTKDLMMFVHGGGWSQCDLDTHDYLCRKLSKILNIDVIAVAYRLAPKHPYPTPLNDVLSAYRYCSGLNYNRIVICGDSAGANLCAALCSRVAKNEKLKSKLYAQVLLYPPLDNNFDSASYKEFENCSELSKQSMIKFFESYAGKDLTDPSLNNNKEIFPLKNNDLTIYPKTMIISAGHDILLDDQTNFAKKLKDAGKDVERVIDKEAFHAYMTDGLHHDKLVTVNCKKIKAYLNL